MKVTANRGAALEALQLAAAVVGGARSDLAVRQDIRIEADGSELRLAATDYEISLHNAVAAKVSKKGALVVPVARMVNILKESDDEEVEFSSDGPHLKIRLPGANYTINGAGPDDYPEVPDPSPDGGPVVDAAALRAMIRRVQYAAAAERSRYTLNGVRWEAARSHAKGGLRLVATDGRRLAMDELCAEKKVKKIKTGIVPLKAMSVLEKVLAGAADEAKVTANVVDNRVVVGVGMVRFSALLLEGNYPEYESVIRDPGEDVAEIDGPALLKAVRQAAVVSDDQSRAVRMTIEGGVTTLSSRSAGDGGGKAEVLVGGLDWSGGKKSVTVAFDQTFLADALKAVGSGKATLDVVSASASAVLRSGESHVNVIMPITEPD